MKLGAQFVEKSNAQHRTSIIAFPHFFVCFFDLS